MVKAGSSLAAALSTTELDVSQLWLRYFAVGGGCSRQALKSYLAGTIDWSAHEHDVVALALNEYFLEHGLDHPVRYAEDIDDWPS